jgi:hypothetical protein
MGGTENPILEHVLKEREKQELRSIINSLTKQKRRQSKYMKLNRPLLSEEAMKLSKEPVEAAGLLGTDEDGNGPNVKIDTAADEIWLDTINESALKRVSFFLPYILSGIVTYATKCRVGFNTAAPT